jgi:hypothetical protein
LAGCFFNDRSFTQIQTKTRLGNNATPLANAKVMAGAEMLQPNAATAWPIIVDGFRHKKR